MGIDIAAQVRRSYEELWHQGNLDFIDENCTPDFVAHDAFAGDVDREGLKGIVQLFRGAFPDIRFRLHEVLVSGNCATVRWSALGTHSGQLLDIAPTGHRVEVQGIGLVHFEGDMESEHWEMWDVMGLMQQLNAAPVIGVPTSVHPPPPGRAAPRSEVRH
ncbi:MAG TPA: ester cyclase [Aggregicoccus sp.]|nr:ester cyclase [Aggregicoccus sp.]